MIDVELDFTFGGKDNIFEVFSSINKCNSCSVAANRTTEIPFPPEYYGDINKIKFALIHQSPMVEDTLDSGVFNENEEYGRFFIQFLKLLGLEREELYISSSLLCADGRTNPKSTDYFNCIKHKYDEFQLLNGLRCVFIMGDVALKQLLDVSFSINQYNKKVFIIDKEDPIFLIPINHVMQYMIKDDNAWRKEVLARLEEIKHQYVIPIKEGEL